MAEAPGAVYHRRYAGAERVYASLPPLTTISASVILKCQRIGNDSGCDFSDVAFGERAARTTHKPPFELMAYTFTDHYRVARLLLRVNAVTIGLGLGVLLLICPRDLLEAAGITLGTAWTARIGGSALIGMGIGLLSAAAQAELRPAVLLASLVSNGAISISLLVAYLEGEMDALHPVGAGGLLVIFIICLLTAVLSVPFLNRKAKQY